MFRSPLTDATGAEDLYQTLGVSREAEKPDLQKAYRNWPGNTNPE